MKYPVEQSAKQAGKRPRTGWHSPWHWLWVAAVAAALLVWSVGVESAAWGQVFRVAQLQEPGH
jgi:hypothetical protein